MVVYGVALLSFCMLVGVFVGDLLGQMIGVEANVGGVGVAMLLLILLSNLHDHGLKISAPTESGINFWNAMYIPIVVAMAAKQNVLAALSSGGLAIAAGTTAVVASFLLVPVMARLGRARDR
ncbi:MAG: malonate transporter subunit MadL [Pseudomonadota bacterium]